MDFYRLIVTHGNFIHQRHRETFPDAVAKPTGGDKTNPPIPLPYWLVAGSIGVVCIDFKSDQLLPCTIFLTFLAGGLVTDEILSGPVDPSQSCPAYRPG